MRKKLRKMLCVCLCLMVSGVFSLTALAGADSGEGATEDWRVTGVLHVSTTAASTTTQTVGYPDVIKTVRARVIGYGTDVNGTSRTSPNTATSSNGMATAASSPSGYLFSYARGYSGTPSVPSAVSLYALAN